VSALASSFTVMFTYLCGLKLIRQAQGAERRAQDDWIAQVGAVTGALMFAYSDSFWENSIEAEVYSLMSMAQIVVFWLGLRWWEEHDRRPTAGPLLLCVYLLALCVALHPGVAILGLPLRALGAAAGVPVPLALLARKTREGRILALALALMVVGYSTHLYLPIRAAQKPAINENNPATWSSLRDLLERKQYGESNMFQRRAP